MSGWIKIHRSITDHWLYSEKRVFSKFEAWHDILLTVNYSESKSLIKGKLYIVKRGQSILSLESWGKRWGWDKSKVRRFMELLQADGMIELVSDNITTQLTVCKYDVYQDERNANETRAKLKRNSNEFQTTPIEEGKEIKEEEEEEEVKNNIPSYFDFLNHALEKIPDIDQEALKLKYDAWVENGWKDGYNKKITNWKSKLTNTLRYLPKLEPQKTQSTPSRRTTNEIFDKVKEDILNGQLEIKPII